MKKNYALIIFAPLTLTLSLSSCNFTFPSSNTSGSITTSTSPWDSEQTSAIQGDGYYKPASTLYSYNDVVQKSPYPIDSVVSVGEQNILVIPIKISGTANATSANRTKIEKAFFGAEDDTGWQSLRTYFYNSSYGKLIVNGVVSNWYDCGYTRSQLSTDTNMGTLVDAAVAWYKSSTSTNCSNFDVDKNGWIDCVCLIYSDSTHTQTEYNQNKTNLWAYTYWQQNNNASVSSPMANTYMWASYDFMNETNFIDIDAHTYIHEFGHCMGLDDYYNYDDNSSYAAAGGFDMQDLNVGDHNPFSKMALGWITPYVVTDSTSLTIRPTATSGDVILLNPTWNGSAFDEYILMELYSPDGMNRFDAEHQTYSGYPKGPTSYGVRMYHIDSRLYKESASGHDLDYIGYADSMSSGYYYEVAATNTTSGSEYATEIYAAKDFKQVHMISASGTNTVATGSFLTNADLFSGSKTFSMNSFKSFFVHSGKFNDNTTMSYAISFSSASAAGVTITFSK
ncbi:MAG: hypothetical protein WC366_03335 [Bacilli bacterium]|jgi:M6 family metalloprotease-like protein